jgi:hypothetical protein
MMMRYALLLLALCVSAPAAADLTATYKARPGSWLTVKVASNGDEAQSDGDKRPDPDRRGLFLIKRAGHDFYVSAGPSGPTVVRAEDMLTVIGEHAARGDLGSGKAPAIELVEKGTATVNGRTGTAWFTRLADGRLSPTPFAVVSHDPALAPLGRAMAHQLEIGALMTGGTVQTASFTAMQDSLKTGVALLLDGSELEAVSASPIPASDFELPAEPETIEVLRKNMMSGLEP